MNFSRSFPRQLLLSLFLGIISVAGYSEANATSLSLSWTDNSTNEEGFKVQRYNGSSYVDIATVAANTVSYTDSGLAAGQTYCYRVRAFNSAGVSEPSNEACATTPVANFTLTLTKTGLGTGLVTSSPVGIDCGSDCSETYSSGTVVFLTATPTSGSTFAGWSGDADCSDGMVTVNASKSCTAIFNLNSQGYTLTVNIASGLSSEGGGSGRVTSSPAGIDCGSDCSETYSPGTVVSLVATPDSVSTFAGWSGDADCADGVVTLNANRSCTATFNLNTITLNLVRIGDGTVSSDPAGIDCGNECSKNFLAGSKVTLKAKPAPHSKFAGWNGGGCQGRGDCTISLSTNTAVAANFVGPSPALIGIFRPATGEWFLDINGNGIWEGCSIDQCLGPFGARGDLPVAGNWTGTGVTLGVFRPSTGEWLLDANGNGKWDGCKIDRCLKSIRPQATLPLVGDWTGVGADMIGEMVSERPPKWYLDLNGNGVLENCSVDACFKFGGSAGDFPVAGDWSGTGTAKLGIFRPSTSEWLLDLNGNGQWNGCNTDRCVKSFGAPGDLPIVGDWTGTGITNIGVYRPTTGEWFLDLNGNGRWDNCGTDGCFQFLSPQEGDLPVAGSW